MWNPHFSNPVPVLSSSTSCCLGEGTLLQQFKFLNHGSSPGCLVPFNHRQTRFLSRLRGATRKINITCLDNGSQDTLSNLQSPLGKSSCSALKYVLFRIVFCVFMYPPYTSSSHSVNLPVKTGGALAGIHIDAGIHRGTTLEAGDSCGTREAPGLIELCCLSQLLDHFRAPLLLVGGSPISQLPVGNEGSTTC